MAPVPGVLVQNEQPRNAQKDSLEKEADVVLDSETDSLKNPNMQTQNCKVVATRLSSESMNEIRKNQRFFKSPSDFRL